MVTMVTVFRGAALRGPLQMSLRVERHARQPDPIGLHSRMVAWPMVGLVTMFRGSLLAFLLEQVQREARVRSSGELVKKDRQGGHWRNPAKYRHDRHHRHHPGIYARSSVTTLVTMTVFRIVTDRHGGAVRRADVISVCCHYHLSRHPVFDGPAFSTP